MKHVTLLTILFFTVSCSIAPSATVQSATTRSSPLPHPATAMTQPSLTPPPLTIAIPTLHPEDAEDALLGLLQRNADCLFPCWFGIMPGETNAQLAKPLLEKLSAISLRTAFHENLGGAHWRIYKDELLIDTIVSFTYSTLPEGNVEYVRATIDVKKQLEEGGFETVWENPLNERYLQSYSLSQVLLTYGQPKNILVFANKGWMYFNLILDYSDQGFVIWYSAPLESSGDKYLGCMSKAFTQLYLWAPKFSYTWAEGVMGTGDESEIDGLNRDFRLLEEVTSITPKEFYSTFANTDHVGCIETSKELWPEP